MLPLKSYRNCLELRKTENGKNVVMSASEYVDNLMTWVSELIDDESVFPSLLNKPFPQKLSAPRLD